jgi:hypothetical protein
VRAHPPAFLFSVLAFAAVAYFGVEWVFASNIGGSAIFSKSRARDMADFSLLNTEISRELRHACQAKPSSAFFFGDQDVLLPYLPTEGDTLFGCKAVLELAPTIIPIQQWRSCNVVGVWEFTPGVAHLNPWSFDQVHAEKFGPHVQIRWQTPDGKTGFIMYEHTCTSAK